METFIEDLWFLFLGLFFGFGVLILYMMSLPGIPPIFEDKLRDKYEMKHNRQLKKGWIGYFIYSIIFIVVYFLYNYL